MKNMIFLSFVLVILFGASCTKKDSITPEPNPPIVETKDTIFQVVWATPIAPESNGVLGVIEVQHYGDYYITAGDNDQPATLYFYNKVTGDLVHTYKYEGSDEREILRMYLIEKMLICLTPNRVFGFDVEQLEVAWNLEKSNGFDYLSNWGTTYNGKFYYTGKWNPGADNSKADLLRIDPYTGEYILLFSRKYDDIGSKILSPPAFYSDVTDGAEMMFINYLPNSKDAPEVKQQKLIAYDMNNLTQEWEVHVTDSFGTHYVIPPVVYEDVVIVGTHRYLIGYDVHTGERLWTTAAREDRAAIWYNANHLIHEDRLYANSVAPEVVCLDPNTGDIIWKNPDVAHCCTQNMVYYQDMLITTSSDLASLIVIDALTGEELHSERGFVSAGFYTDPVYDPELDMFFTSTFDYAIGFKINKPE